MKVKVQLDAVESTAGLKRIERQLKKLREMTLRVSDFEDQPLPSGSRSLDGATGLGGLPRALVVALVGTPQTRTHTLAYAAIATTQAKGGIAALVDFANALTVADAQRHGIDLNKLLIIRPDSLAQGFAAAERLTLTGTLDLLVLQGPTEALRTTLGTPHSEKQVQDWQSRLRDALQGLTRAASESSTCVLYASDLSSPTSIVAKATEQTLRSQLFLFIRLAGKCRSGRLGIEITVDGEMRRAYTRIDPSGRISSAGDLLEFGLDKALVTRAGAHLIYSGVKLGTSPTQAVRKLQSQLDLLRGLAAAVKDELVRMRERAAALPRVGIGLKKMWLVTRKSSGASLPAMWPIARKSFGASKANVRADRARRDERRADRARRDERRAPARPLKGKTKGQTKNAATKGETGIAPPKVVGTKATSRTSSTGATKDEAKRQKPKRGGRYVNTWFDGDEPLLPLVVGRCYLFNIQVSAQRRHRPAHSEAFVEPEFGPHHEVPLLVSLYSEDFQISCLSHTLKLARGGDSLVAETQVVPLRPGRAQIRAVISLLRELEVLQRLTVDVEVIEDAQKTSPPKFAAGERR